MKDCLFCKIAIDPKQRPYFIYEDKHFLAMPDLSQFTEGHILVIPKKHYRWVWDLPTLSNSKNEEPTIGEYFTVCQKITNHLQKIYQVEQVYTLTMGSTITHAHIHLIPRTSGNWYEVLQKIGKLQQSRISFKQQAELAKKLQISS